MPFIENWQCIWQFLTMVHILYHWILTIPWTVTYLHFTDGETTSLRVLIRWYGHPTVYLVSKAVLQPWFYTQEKTLSRKRGEKKGSSVRDISRKVAGTKIQSLEPKYESITFSFLSQEKEGWICGAVGGPGEIQSALSRGSWSPRDEEQRFFWGNSEVCW